jgi:FtsZ-interacting cell division protein ZipA
MTVLILIGVIILLAVVVFFLIKANRKEKQETKKAKIEAAKAELKKARIGNVLSYDKKLEEKLSEEFKKIDNMDDDDLLARANGMHMRP